MSCAVFEIFLSGFYFRDYLTLPNNFVKDSIKESMCDSTAMVNCQGASEFWSVLPNDVMKNYLSLSMSAFVSFSSLPQPFLELSIEYKHGRVLSAS